MRAVLPEAQQVNLRQVGHNTYMECCGTLILSHCQAAVEVTPVREIAHAGILFCV